VLPDHRCKSARHDYTLAQLFACLVLREFFGLSFRRTEQLLRDSPPWLADIGLIEAPDHNTLWRAFELITRRRFNGMLDLQVAAFARARRLRLGRKPLAMDSTCFERHHRSVHYDRRCRQMAYKDAAKDGIVPQNPGKWGACVNASRRRRVSTMPKLSVAVASACHLILSAVTRRGNGSDAPDFDPLLFHAWRRACVKVVVADASEGLALRFGYDSEANHRIARLDMGVRSIIPAGIGRPTSKLPTGRWRRLMAKRFKRKADKKQYAQRSQSETVHSMVKRNLGSALRARTPARQEKEMMLRVLTHNIMLLAAAEQDPGE
jgi:hypothetical protein